MYWNCSEKNQVYYKTVRIWLQTNYYSSHVNCLYFVLRIVNYISTRAQSTSDQHFILYLKKAVSLQFSDNSLKKLSARRIRNSVELNMKNCKEIIIGNERLLMKF